MELHKHLGKQLGAGAYKMAFECTADPNVIVLKTYTGYDIAGELAELERLKAMGMPVVEIFNTIDDGDNCYFVCKRYVKSNKDIAAKKEEYDLVSEKTVRDFARIERAANAHFVDDISDFQFLWAKDGSIALNDPGSISCNKARYERVKAENRLWWQRQQAHYEYIMAMKAGDIVGAWDNAGLWKEHARAWWFKGKGRDIAKARRQKRIDAEKNEAAWWASQGVPTHYHTWRQLSL